MKILLVCPNCNGKYMAAQQRLIRLEPLALEYVGAGVSGEHEVKILDMRLENGIEGLRGMLERFRPEIVGTTGISPEATVVKEVHALAKRFDSSILTVAGGIHATVAPEDLLSPDIDIVVIGEGVFTFKEIVEHFEKGQDFRDIRGIALPDGDKQYKTPPRPWCDVDDMPLPDRSLTSHIRHKYSLNVWSNHVAALRTVIGCPYRCEFCICWKLTDHNKVLRRDVESVIEELKAIKEPYVMIIDDEFLCHTKRAWQIARRIKEEGINKQYFMFARADVIVNNQDLVKAWREIGASEVFVGIEAVTDQELCDMRKNTEVSVNDKALKILKDNGLACLSAMIVDPRFGKEEFQKMIDYCIDRELECPVFQVMTPFPGTDLYERVKDQIIYPDWDLFDFMHALLPTKSDLKEFYFELTRLQQVNYGPAPVKYHTEKLAALPEDVRQETLEGIAGIIEVNSSLWEDHFPVRQAV